MKDEHIAFSFDSYSFDPETGVVLLKYKHEDVAFEETYTIPMDGVDLESIDGIALDRALFALHLMSGISYWKASCSPNIEVKSGTLSREAAHFWNNIYTKGLGEFFYKNEIDFRDLIHFPYEKDLEADEIHGPSETKMNPLVAIGGGKDSVVASKILQAHNLNITLFTTKDAAPIRKTSEELGAPRLVVSRTISPTLIELNKDPKTLNGHVPITAILGFVGVVTAILHSNSDVVFALESSASEGNLEYLGEEINHQYSKSIEFERALQHYLSEFITKDVRVFSILRPFSELEIVKRFSTYPEYFNIFSSCNRNFTFKATDESKQTFWCCECPKCAFMFIMLNAFIPHEKVVEIFGRDLMNDEPLLPTFKELLGVQGNKPFECVGEAREVAAALELAHRRGDCEDTMLMQLFVNELRDQSGDLDAIIEDLTTPSGDHAIPQEYEAYVK